MTGAPCRCTRRVPLDVRVIDSDGNLLQKTSYVYDATTGEVLTVEKLDPSTVADPFSDSDPYCGTPLYTESNTYYPSSGRSTPWLESHADTRGCWTHYVRDTSNLANILAVQTAGPGLPSEPSWGTDYNNPPINIATTKIYTYYSSTDSAGGMSGQVKTEVVPGAGWLGGSQVAYVDSTGYVYVDTAGYHNSPTQTTYHYTDGSTKTSTTLYDAMGRVLSATDANGQLSATLMTLWAGSS